MTSSRVLIHRAVNLNERLNKAVAELSIRLENKLGDGWGVTPQTDGICVIDEDSANYYLSVELLADALKQDRESAIKIIKHFEI
jgi:hypothetical protein